MPCNCRSGCGPQTVSTIRTSELREKPRATIAMGALQLLLLPHAPVPCRPNSRQRPSTIAQRRESSRVGDACERKLAQTEPTSGMARLTVSRFHVVSSCPPRNLPVVLNAVRPVIAGEVAVRAHLDPQRDELFPEPGPRIIVPCDVPAEGTTAG